MPTRRQDSPSSPRRHRPVDVADRLHSAAIHLLRRLRAEDDASGLTAPRLSALSVIVFRGPLTLGELAAAEQVSPPTISRLVAGLERDGLVRRSPGSGDRRIHMVSATAAGRRLLAHGRRRRVAKLAVSVAALPAADRSALERAIGVMEKVGRVP
jgi:DNA-binding MarR family transcriptional regulator